MQHEVSRAVPGGKRAWPSNATDHVRTAAKKLRRKLGDSAANRAYNCQAGRVAAAGGRPRRKAGGVGLWFQGNLRLPWRPFGRGGSVSKSAYG